MRNILKINPQLVQFKRAQFSVSANDLLKNSFEQFRTKYQQSTQDFRQKMTAQQGQNQFIVEKPMNKAYQHPYHSDHHPVNFSSVKNAEYFHDLIGPEQVSPHYENFMMARKWAIGFWVGLGLISFGYGSADLHWIAKNSLIPFFYWMFVMYFYLEGRKSIFKPLLMRFYRKIAANECHNFDIYYHENIEQRVRELIRISKSQLEYYQIHQDYAEVKADSIQNFLATEELNLQHHIAQRTQLILQQAETFEKANRDKFLQQIIDNAQAEIDAALKGPQKDQIQKQILDSAIQGLAQGYMDYPNDPILPIVNKSIHKAVEQVQKMTPQQQLKLVSLTDNQLRILKEEDVRVKNEYLNHQPNIDAGLKSNENVKRILATWGQK